MRISQVSFTYQFLAYSHSGVKKHTLYGFYFFHVVYAQHLAHFVFYQSLRKICISLLFRNSN